MQTTAIYPNRQKDKERIEKEYGLDEFGVEDIEFFSSTGLLLATGYTRIVYGDHGPYIEFDQEQIEFESWEMTRSGRWPRYYATYYPKDGSNIKLYDQKRDVKHLPNPPKGKSSFRGNREEGYADYKVGFCYIAPDEIAKPKEKKTLFD